jgi:hypothetical protein
LDKKEITTGGAPGGGGGGKPQLSRREREEIDKAKAKAHYQKMHAAGNFFLLMSHQFVFRYLVKVTKNKKITCLACLLFFQLLKTSFE